MRQKKLNYRFHNPNTAEASAEYLTRIFIESGRKKVEMAINEAASQTLEAPKENMLQSSARHDKIG